MQFNVSQMSRDSSHSTYAFYFCSLDSHNHPPFLIPLSISDKQHCKLVLKKNLQERVLSVTYLHVASLHKEFDLIG